jgi:phosphoglucan,water dikinase
VLLLRSAEGDEEIPIGVAAIALAHEIPHLSHLSVRARQAHVVLIACEEVAEFERLQSFEGQVISLNALPDRVSWETNADQSPPAVKPRTTSMGIPRVRLSPKSPWLPLEQATAKTGGGKAAGARRLAEISLPAGADFSTPRSLVIPFGVMEMAMTKMVSANGEYRDLVERLGPMEPAKFADSARRLQEIIQELAVPEIITTEICRAFGASSTLVVRSSANCEDLEEFAGAGLYESVINVSITEVASAIRTVWSSLWTLRAAESRRAGGILHDQAHMAVLVQELLDPDFSFVLHTVNPITHGVREVYAEIVVGLGETLASAATFGTPYRLTCDKNSAAVTVLAFANFSHATRPNPGGGVRRETVDYSEVDLSMAAGALEKLGRRLSAIGVFVEGALGGPQDIEGAVVKGRVYLVQTRPQQGLPPGKGR